MISIARAPLVHSTIAQSFPPDVAEVSTNVCTSGRHHMGEAPVNMHTNSTIQSSQNEEQPSTASQASHVLPIREMAAFVVV